MPVKDLPPRGNVGNDKRTREGVHGDKPVRSSTRPTASDGVYNKTYYTPSDAA